MILNLSRINLHAVYLFTYLTAPACFNAAVDELFKYKWDSYLQK